MSYTYPFPMVSATATVLLVDDIEYPAQFLTGVRSPTADVYPDQLCLPGGFLNAKVPDKHPGERIEQTALREVFEETGIQLVEDQLRLFHVHSDPNTDPRAHVINVCFWARLTREQVNSAQAGDDLSELEWILDDTDTTSRPFAFNHADIFVRGVRAWRSTLRYE